MVFPKFSIKSLLWLVEGFCFEKYIVSHLRHDPTTPSKFMKFLFKSILI